MEPDLARDLDVGRSEPLFSACTLCRSASIKLTTLEGARSLAFPGAALPIWLYQCEVA